MAGERRLRAARMAGLKEVPCLVSAVGEEDAALLALIENIQRRDLNYMEETAALQKLIAAYGLSQEQVAEKLGRSQSAVANKLRLLKLSPGVRRRFWSTDSPNAMPGAAAPGRRGGACSGAGGDSSAKHERRSNRRVHRVVSAGGSAQGQTPAAQLYHQDVRLFLNSINHSMDVMRRAGVDAKCGREETEDTITLTICIPKNKTAPIA